MSTSTSYDLDVTCLAVLSEERERSKNTGSADVCLFVCCVSCQFLSHFVSFFFVFSQFVLHCPLAKAT